MLGSPIRDRQAERRSDTRAEILEAAWVIAREKGLAELTLREVGARIGMRAPSLYSYFDSKNAIYDAMFAQAWSGCLAAFDDLEKRLPRTPRAELKKMARAFFDYAVADLARHQLMNQRTISGFVPSTEAYAPAVGVLERVRSHFVRCGVDRADHFDLYIALVGGLIDAQQANDPGGSRWSALLDQAIDMFADHVGLPESRRKST
ncbi:MAG: TetR/AcrR family transcriptional regulator [Pseudonocardiales bacterium]|nr:MAG: TetR/AcrR family transcriptional regulator [Pseudonocardiales bacterium]